jgi:hypothetical protein
MSYLPRNSIYIRYNKAVKTTSPRPNMNVRLSLGLGPAKGICFYLYRILDCLIVKLLLGIFGSIPFMKKLVQRNFDSD